MAEQVRLLADPAQMTPEDRVRYFLGLPQGYPVNPEHWRNIQGRLMARYVSRNPALKTDDPRVRKVARLRDAPMPQLDRALDQGGYVKPGEMYGSVPVKEHGEGFMGPPLYPRDHDRFALGSVGKYLTPFEMLLLKDTMGDELPGARQAGESLQQARQRLARAKVKGQ